MKCAACGAKWSATDGSTGPGGYDAPGVFLITARVMCVIAGVLLLVGTTLWAMAFGSFGLLALVATGSSMSLAKETGSDECPDCGSRARIRPWSM